MPGRSESSNLIQFLGQIGAGERGEPVGFFVVAGHLGEEGVGSEPDRAAKILADLLVDRFFHPATHLQGVGYAALVQGKLTGHFVDGTDLFDRQHRLDGFHDLLVRADVMLVATVGRAADADSGGGLRRRSCRCGCRTAGLRSWRQCSRCGWSSPEPRRPACRAGAAAAAAPPRRSRRSCRERANGQCSS